MMVGRPKSQNLIDDLIQTFDPFETNGLSELFAQAASAPSVNLMPVAAENDPPSDAVKARRPGGEEGDSDHPGIAEPSSVFGPLHTPGEGEPIPFVSPHYGFDSPQVPETVPQPMQNSAIV